VRVLWRISSKKIDQGGGPSLVPTLEDYVVKVSGNTVYINLGKSLGIMVGDRINISYEGETIVDPKTGEILERELILVAEARVTRVKDKLSEAIITSKTKGMAVSEEDVVEVVTSTLED